MDITYCYEKCRVGKAASDTFLELNNSVIEAATDFGTFAVNCFKTCQFSNRHENKCTTKEHSV